MSITVEYAGRELRAETTSDGGWRVATGGRTIEARYLDYALAELLGIQPRQAIPLATRIVELQPDEDDEASAL